ncbi:MAG: hypothetical protein KAV42_05775 [Candidatus Krumholzibacteria bacterium]|nr:hypothetical protein [Candidatus Krumholzibacteria bacterium]
MNSHKFPFFAHKMISIVFCLLLASLIAGPMTGCGDDQGAGPGSGGEEPSWTLSYVSGCKGSAVREEAFAKQGEDPVTSSEITDDCFEYLYDTSGTLHITHSNFTLNCCPGTIGVDIVIEGDSITIQEVEGPDAEPCDCLCLYDITIEILGLTPGTYTIIFDELYYNGGDILRAQIELYQGSSGRVCVERTGYPWI